MILLLLMALQDPAPRVAVPAADVQKRVQKIVRDFHKAEFASKDLAILAQLVTTLQVEAQEADRPADQKYALLTEARELAWKLGDVPAALASADAIAAFFEVDAAAVRLETLDEAAKRAKSPAALAAAAEAYLTAAEALDERYDEALKLVRKAEAPAKSSKDADLAARVKALLDELKSAQAEQVKAQAMREKLAADPADPEANLVVGLYLCFTRGDREAGWKCLVKGSDAAVSALAAQELAPPAKADGMIALAEGWWGASQKREPRHKDGFQGRAFSWYDAARTAADKMPKLEGAAVIKKIDAFFEGLGAKEGGLVLPGNVALAKAGAKATGDNQAGEMIDGITTGYTGGNGFMWAECPGTFVISLARPCLLRQIRMLIWDLDNRYYQYILETSPDGKTFVPLVDRSKGEWRSWQVINFPARRVKAIRLKGTYNSTGNGFHIVELEAYCTPPAAAPKARPKNPE